MTTEDGLALVESVNAMIGQVTSAAASPVNDSASQPPIVIDKGDREKVEPSDGRLPRREMIQGRGNYFRDRIDAEPQEVDIRQRRWNNTIQENPRGSNRD